MRHSLSLALSVSVLGTAAAAQDTTLSYMMWDPTQLEIEKALIAEFEESHPGVEVDVQAMPPEDYWPKLSAQAAAGDLPDVFAMSSAYVKSWANAGNLADLSEFADSTDLSGYFEGAMEPGIVDGTRVAFPQNWVAPVLFYNKDVFDEAGLDYPGADWTWEDVRSAAEKLTQDADDDDMIEQWGLWLYGRYAHIEPWVFRNGGRYVNDEGEIALNEEAVHALEFLTGLVREDKVAPPPQEMEGVRQQDIFPLQMAAMWVDGSWNIANTRDMAPDDMNWGIAQVPEGPDATEETAAAYAWSDMLAIAKNSDNKEMAWEFIQFMVGEGREASDFLGGKVPAYRPIAESEAWLEPEKQPAEKGIILDIGEQPVYTGFTEDWSAWRGYAAEGTGGMNGEIDEVLNGRKSLDEAIEAFTAYGNEILGR